MKRTLPNRDDCCICCPAPHMQQCSRTRRQETGDRSSGVQELQHGERKPPVRDGYSSGAKDSIRRVTGVSLLNSCLLNSFALLFFRQASCSTELFRRFVEP